MYVRILFPLIALLAALPGHAHRASDSYLSLEVDAEAIAGHWEIALRDLDNALGLDSDGDGRIVWGEVRTRALEIEAFALAHLELRGDAALCPARAIQAGVNRRMDGAYLVLDLSFGCPAETRSIEVDYTLFADLDGEHRGFLRFESAGVSEASVLGGETRVQRFTLAGLDPIRAFRRYAGEGVWHIFIGLDHVLFLICLLLAAVSRARATDGEGEGLARVALRVVKLVSAFTLAHSITLALAATGLVELPARWVESAIAASVAVVALRNLLPGMRGEGARLAFGFGLLHGLGFASVLGELGLPPGALAPALLGFNLGVEAGQLAITLGVVPLAFALRDTALYRRGVLPVGSLAMAGVAALWLVERSLEIDAVRWL